MLISHFHKHPQDLLLLKQAYASVHLRHKNVTYTNATANELE